ncbi:MAG TPA: nitrile hydratase subunit alpha [Solirubrobacteraceae bacterium]|nr:nitrile hydratase subunit alpha [Solirubrobacteraceae bacterium]
MSSKPPDPDLGTYQPLTYYQMREVSLRELLVEKGVITEAEVQRAMGEIGARSPERGAKMVARAWLDPAYKARMLADGSKAAEELGFEVPALKLIVVENTEDTHNVIVCTLCSCYPWPVLGLPPSWYKSEAYRARVIAEPRSVLQEFGVELDADIEVRVWDSSAEVRYLVLPMRPAGTEDLGEDELAALVTRDCMVGTALP